MDCPTIKTKLGTLQQENNKLLTDKRDLLADRKRDKEEMERLSRQIAVAFGEEHGEIEKEKQVAS